MNAEPIKIHVDTTVKVRGPLLKQKVALALWQDLRACEVAGSPLTAQETALYEALTAHFAALASFTFIQETEFEPV